MTRFLDESKRHIRLKEDKFNMMYMFPIMLLGLFGIKMFLFKKCMKPSGDVDASKASKASKLNALQVSIDATVTELLDLEAELDARHQVYNDDLATVESKRHEVMNRKDYVVQLTNTFHAYLAGDSFVVPDFQTLCEKFTSAQKDLDDATAELHVLEVEQRVKYEEWPALALDKKNVIELVKTKLINLQDDYANERV
jgi:hypothetical protein